MQATGGRLLAKEGAEGVICVAAVDDDWGLAVKVEDGAIRAVGPAIVELMETAGVLHGEECQALQEIREVSIDNTLGERVGIITARRADMNGDEN